LTDLRKKRRSKYRYKRGGRPRTRPPQPPGTRAISRRSSPAPSATDLRDDSPQASIAPGEKGDERPPDPLATGRSGSQAGHRPPFEARPPHRPGTLSVPSDRAERRLIAPGEARYPLRCASGRVAESTRAGHAPRPPVDRRETAGTARLRTRLSAPDCRATPIGRPCPGVPAVRRRDPLLSPEIRRATRLWSAS
jgi:hypothetical protein